MPVVLFIMIALLLLSLVIAFVVRASWAFSLPGLMLLVIILYMLFVP